MKTIKKLENHLINKIAAGEVVDRPLSIVKELVENAIDAGASTVTVEIMDGGLTQIRVTDNGYGISPDQLPLAFMRHATSKIEDSDDLFNIQTMGFRGEALASIAAVSQVEMITKTADSVMGARIAVHGGDIIETGEIGCLNGTTLVVSNLFYNIPARRKFVKKPATEGSLIADIMQKLALANPGCAFRFINDGRLIFQTNGMGDLKTAIHYVFGRDISSKLVEIDVKTNGMSLYGYVGKPEIARGNRGYGYFIINRRYIKNRVASQAVEDALKQSIQSGKFPVYVLNLTINPGEVDVNVHPAKLEVRFDNDEAIYRFINESVKKSLSEINLIPEVKIGVKAVKPVVNEIDIIQSQLLISEPTPPIYENKGPNIDIVKNDENDIIQQKPPKENENFAILPQAPEKNISAPPFFTNYLIMGLLFQTYWLVEQGDSLYLIDQHAAHERVLYEEIMGEVKNKTISAQPLIEPVRLKLTPKEAQALRDNKDIFEKGGFEVEEGSFGQFDVITVPYFFNNPISPGFFIDILDKLKPYNVPDTPNYEKKASIIAMAACKGAVKAKDALNETEAEALISALIKIENPFNCPHGRPTIIEITKNEIERKFLRKT